MRANEINSSVTAMIKAQIPTFIWGPPGIGKSSIVKQIAETNAYEFIDLRLALMDPTDLKGIPFYDKDEHQALWAPPSFLPREGKGILFLDELNSAPPAVQASAYQLILDRKVGEYTLPDGWAIVAAGNREGDRGVVYRMPSPLANRFVHLEMDVSVEDWRDWAYDSAIDKRVIAYIGYKSDDLFSFDPTKNEKSFATPRSWEFVSSVLQSGMDEKLLLETIGGAIGKERAVRFLSFAKVMHKLPNIEAILESGQGDYPEEVDVLHALATGLVMAVRQNPSSERMDNLLNYTFDLQSEFSVMVVQDLQRAGFTMEEQKNFSKWVGKFAYLLA
ncbi:MAG: MoxR family ATPase [Sulfurimonadaceae bacterium]